MVNKRVWNAVLGCNLKNNKMISVHFQGKPFNITIIEVLSPDQWCWRSWSWMVLWRPTRPFRINTLKRCPFHHRELECKSWKSRDTWSNRLIWPWSKKWSRAKANRVLPREHISHTNQCKHPFLTIQEITLHIHVTKWSILKSDWLHSLQLKMERHYHISSVQLLSRVRLFATP